MNANKRQSVKHVAQTFLSVVQHYAVPPASRVQGRANRRQGRAKFSERAVCAVAACSESCALPAVREKATISAKPTQPWRARLCQAVMPIVLAAFFLVTGTLRARLPEPQPAWVEADSEERFLFTMPHELRFCLVRLPAELAQEAFISGIGVVAGDLAVPARIVHSDEHDVYALLDTTYVAGGSTVCIYAFGGEDAALRKDGAPRDPAPLAGEVRRVAGQDYPEAWQAHLFQRRRMGQPFRSFRAVSFEHAGRESNPEKWRQEWTRSGYCVELSTWLRVPQDGVYKFAAKGANSIFLVLGEEAGPVLEAAGGKRLADDEAAADSWVTGEEITLKAGVYPLRVVQISRRFSNCVAGWVMPGSDSPQALPVELMLSGQKELPILRRELRQAVVQSGFNFAVAPGYRFSGHSRVFSSVKLQSSAVDWLGDAMSLSWHKDGSEFGRGEETSVVLGAGLHKLTLRARNSLGFESVAGHQVRVPDFALSEYLVAGSLQGVPAISYPEDRIWPDLWVTGSLPPHVPVQASLRIRDRHQRTEKMQGDLNLQRGWGNLQGRELLVGDMDEISWEIRHGGSLLASRTTRFLHQPFELLPERAVGNELHHGDWQVILVPHQQKAPANSGSARPVEKTSGCLPRRIMCLDSTLSPPGWYSGRKEEAWYSLMEEILQSDYPAAEVKHHDYVSLASPGDENLRTLAPLAALQMFGREDCIVVSLGLEAIVEREPVGFFERRLAALCGLLRDTVGATVLLVTPPALGNDHNTARPYAEAVLRVADSCNCIVADLFTAFAGHAEPHKFYDGLRVTVRGQSLAARVIARSIISSSRDFSPPAPIQ